ncbi:ATP-dependent RNA helicase HrpB [Caulifigura coniformis]|uniref:ATP-dependent RNA helicase HrpB n=1 Tax=Caulifigura coniformis TaxID=2527983 RepID=A0A517SFR7_9PLAN|nr:ATP-dependent RNA helicase HrpA [Caulifigura coniformis]QDT54968.1 ATP-dependent RNA helicase HrpB [Caulifigura coniformis]
MSSSSPAPDPSTGEDRAPTAGELTAKIDQAMQADRHRLRQMLRRFPRGKAPDRKSFESFERLLKSSTDRADERRRRHPALGEPARLTFDDPLPICERIDEIAAAIQSHQVVVVAGETGSGKSTQLPKICLKLGRGVFGMIGHTQPRRIAARSVAARVAEELGTRVGEGVGFKVRFTDAVTPKTHVKVMTDGILLAELQSDRYLDAYDTIIIDEAHERSLNIDLILGQLHRLLKKRPDLRVIITSATIDAARFAAFFDSPDGRVDEDELARRIAAKSDPTAAQDGADSCALPSEDEHPAPTTLPPGPETLPRGTSTGAAPVIEVSGRTYPVETRYRPLSEDGDADLNSEIANAIVEVMSEGPGDVLTFLATERDIREVAEVLRGRLKQFGPAFRSEILPLYGRLSEQDQQKVFQPHGGQRVVLATNVAESSLTVPGIRYVVDTGTVRLSRFAPQSKVQRLPIEPISRASADQRKGRCGRIGPGICVRLFSREDFESRDAYTQPEILRTNLAAAVLQTISYGLGDLNSMPLIDRPQPGAVRAGVNTLLELGAIRDCEGKQSLTETGRLLTKLPVDPRIGRMIAAAHDEHCLSDILIIASALEVRDPRDRPAEKQQAADEAHKQFAVEGSDFLSLLKLWDIYQDWADKLSNSRLRKACQQNFVSFARMREWRDLHRQLARLVTGAGLKTGPRHGDADAIHRALLAGLLSNIAVRGDSNEYSGAGDQSFFLWPGSAAAGKKPKWIVAAELVETTRRFARTVGPINPDWLERVGAHLVKRSYSEPHWDRKTAQTMAFEKVTLYGLPVVPRRRCRYAPVDPAKSREMFIQHALIEGDWDSNAKFVRHNIALKEELSGWQAKLRQTQIFASEEMQFRFFDERLPGDVTDGPRFEQWRKQAEQQAPELLFLTKAVLLADPSVVLDQKLFPDTVAIGASNATVEYKLDPSSPTDGVTVVVPARAAAHLDASRLGWLVPGMLQEKVESLLKALPKEHRRLFLPIQETAAKVAAALDLQKGDLEGQMSAALRRIGGEHVPVDLLTSARIPDHLQVKVRVVDDKGETVAAGADVERIKRELHGRHVAKLEETEAAARWARTGLTDWTIGELPASVDVGEGTRAFPMLFDEGSSVGLKLSHSAEIAERNTRRALVRLFGLLESKKISQQVQHLPRIEPWSMQGASILAAVDTLGGAAPSSTPKGFIGAFRSQVGGRIAERATAHLKEIPRDEAAFRRFMKQASNQMSVAVLETGELLEPLLPRARDAQKIVSQSLQAALEVSHRDSLSQWLQLFRPGFLSETPWESLQSYPRYLDAFSTRWKKLKEGGLARDRELTAKVALFWNKYVDIVSKRPTLRTAFEPVRWLIEEYRVSLWAQQLRTAQPVSEKRLRDAWEAAINEVKSGA